jgi:nicotinamidase-related amidase
MTTTTYAADRTALLIVDPYNDFMSEGGKFYEATKETTKAVGFYAHAILTSEALLALLSQ